MTVQLVSPAPRLAILIPIYRHPALLIEAIESVLSQRFEGGLRLLLVSDGCPLPETDAACRDYARAYPEIITYLRKSNGGLSDARNFGIRHVLEHLPSVEAIYMLDADNSLFPDAMARAMAALENDPAADWIYPNIDMFGLEARIDYGGKYSSLIHTKMNICEAGSLIRRHVFEAGVFFDTDFKMGWEDWDFFLSSARQGFRGKNIENFGFRYRKRPESMLADSEREQGALLGAMQQKHKAALKPDALLQMEQNEAPRYAIHLSDRNQVLYCVDPLAPGTDSRSCDAFETEYWLAQSVKGRTRVPPFNIVMPSNVMEGLRQAGLLHWVLWKLETLSEKAAIVVLTVSTNGEDRFSIAENFDTRNTGNHREAIAVAIRGQVFKEVMHDAKAEWIDTLASNSPSPSIVELNVRIPASSPTIQKLNRPTAVFDTLSLIHRLRASRYRDASMHNWGYRENGIPFRGREHEIVRERVSRAPVFPKVKDEQQHIGFLLPLVEFGGVEKVALQMARGLRAHGLVPHAVVLEARDIALTADWAEVFETTNLLADASFRVWGQGAKDYLGTNIPAWSQGTQHGPVLGVLHWFDAVINLHGGSIAGVAGQLRRMGIKTLNSLHLNDLTPMGRPVGNTHLGLAYEHAFDFFVPCSNMLGNWLHGMGVPRDKIVPVPNGPGFEIASEVSAEAIRARAKRSPQQPLRILFLGRLDRQKGLDRLVEVIRKTRAQELNLEWRVIGKSIIAEDAPPLPPEITEILEPPMSLPADLAEAYAWADVVVLLSRYEGLPLTILEAQRAGAWVIATDVGAVSEVIQTGENGTLLSDKDAVSGCVDALEALAAMPQKVRRSATEVGQFSQRPSDWVTLVEPLVEVLKR